MNTKTLSCFLFVIGVLGTSAFAGTAPTKENNNMKALKEKVGYETWKIIKQRSSKQYRNKVMEWLEKVADRTSKLDTDKSKAKKQLRQYYKLRISYLESNYFVVEDQLITVPEQPTISTPPEHDFPKSYSSGLSQKKEEQFIRKALAEARGKTTIPEGAKVFIRSMDKQYRVIFQSNLEPIAKLGPSFAAKVIIDKETEKVKKVLVGEYNL